MVKKSFIIVNFVKLNYKKQLIKKCVILRLSSNDTIKIDKNDL